MEIGVLEAKGVEGSDHGGTPCKKVDDHGEEKELEKEKNSEGRSSSRNTGKKKVDSPPAVQERKRKRRRRKKTTKKKEACVECTDKCLMIHGCSAQLPLPPPTPLQEGDTAPPLPRSFFKIMIGDFSKVLFIPPKFCRTLEHLVDEYVNIRDSFGLRWRVKLSSVGGSLAFSDGWQNFVLDHLIKVGELVVFTFISRRIIYAHIFSISACERQHFCERNQRQSRKKKKRKLFGDNTHCSENLYHSHSLKKQLVIAGEISAGRYEIIQTANPNSGKSRHHSLELHKEVLEPSDKSIQIYNGFQALASSVSCNDTSFHIIGEGIPSLPATADTFISSLPITEMLEPLEATKRIPIQNSYNHNPLPQQIKFEKFTENMASCGKLVENCSTNELKDQVPPIQTISEDLISKRPMPFLSSICDDNNKISETELCYEAAILPENDDILDGFQNVSPLECYGPAVQGHMEQTKVMLTHLNNEEMFSTVDCSLPDTAHCDSVNEMEKQKLDSLGLPVFSEFKCDEVDTNKTTKNSLSAPQTSGFNSNKNNSSASFHNIQCNSINDFQIALAVTSDGHSPFSNSGNDKISADQTAIPISYGSLNNIIVTKSGSTINYHESEIEYHMPYCEDTQSQRITGEENTDFHGGIENSYKIVTSKSLRSPDSLEETSNHAEVKEEDTCAEFRICKVKTECPSPVSLPMPDYGIFSFSMQISASSWLELPFKLPFRLTKRNCGRKIVILQDSCMQLWPVLYQKSNKFIGFTAGWKDFAEGNNLNIGDKCEFELCKAPEATLKVKLYNMQDHPSG